MSDDAIEHLGVLIIHKRNFPPKGTYRFAALKSFIKIIPKIQKNTYCHLFIKKKISLLHIKLGFNYFCNL